MNRFALLLTTVAAACEADGIQSIDPASSPVEAIAARTVEEDTIPGTGRTSGQGIPRHERAIRVVLADPHPIEPAGSGPFTGIVIHEADRVTEYRMTGDLQGWWYAFAQHVGSPTREASVPISGVFVVEGPHGSGTFECRNPGTSATADTTDPIRFDPSPCHGTGDFEGRTLSGLIMAGDGGKAGYVVTGAIR